MQLITNKTEIKNALEAGLEDLVKLFPWLSVRYEYSPKHHAYIVSYDIDTSHSCDADFWKSSMDFEDGISSKFGDDAPLFCDNERLFTLSKNACVVNYYNLKSMNKDINIAALLKDCPEGTKLYSPICGECEYDGITGLGHISVLCDNQESGWDFDKYGHLCDDTGHKGECLLFPSEEVRDWKCFNTYYVRMHDGMSLGERDKAKELLYAKGAKGSTAGLESADCVIWYIDRINNVIRDKCEPYSDYILSTGTELKLEEEQPKFKVGDVIRTVDGKTGIVTVCHDKFVHFDYHNGVHNDYYKPNELIENITLATSEEITKWNKKVLEPNRLHYSKSKRKIIDWFLPFDKVVTRFEEDKSVNWIASFYSHFNGKDFVCVDGTPYAQCLPYNERTAKLIGTTDNYKGE